MNVSIDGPAASRFAPVPLEGNVSLRRFPKISVSEAMSKAAIRAPRGDCVAWGIPFHLDRAVLLHEKSIEISAKPFLAQWLVFQHTSDLRRMESNDDGFYPHTTGVGHLDEHAADYVIVYANRREVRVPIRRRHEIGAFHRIWGENCFSAVAHHKPYPLAPAHEQRLGEWNAWGDNEKRSTCADAGRPWTNWLFAWENPFPRSKIVALRFEPVSGAVVVSAISRGKATAHPLRWEPRTKALLRLPRGLAFQPDMDDIGRLAQIQLDMGQVISARPRPLYPNETWAHTYNNCVPAISDREILVEYTAHPDARFHLWNGKTVPVATLATSTNMPRIESVAPAIRSVTLRTIDKTTRKPVAVKLHVHGEAGEYLAPIDRHRIPNPAWFEDYSVDFLHQGKHWCTYIPGETTVRLPVGHVYVEVSKGFEMRPLRKALRVTRTTKEITIEIERILPWRDRGWVSADTHVHFLSPGSALLEGAGEGVNVVNLLASQWGELMTNVGDFDARITHGSREAGGDGEHLVRVGTENRQHILGHISLLGYQGGLIAPMTTGGPDESALGDPVEVLLTEWARQCKQRKGLVVIPHFPNPRAEHAATIVDGSADAVEMTSWGLLYGGIDPYSLSDWYRYLNCGYLVAAVGGTDKMSASTPVGAVRTYAHIPPDRDFSYNEWMKAVRRAETFVTYGPLLEFSVEGKPAGSRIAMSRSGGSITVEWEAASVTVPMSRVELIVNGEIRESRAVRKTEDRGRWSVKLDRSSWLALLVRGHYADKPEIIAAHSSPVMVKVGATPFFAAADAVTILEQIEGALAYVDTVGTRAETVAYKRMRAVLTGAHRKLHNRMHRHGMFHKHSPADLHPGHDISG